MPSGNVKNLRPFNTMPEEERKAIQARAVEASREARKRRKTLKEGLLALLDDDGVQTKILLSLIKEATNGNNSGSVARAFETIRDTIGEKPTDKMEVGNIDGKPFEAIDLGKLSNEQLQKMVAERDEKLSDCGTDAVNPDDL